MARRRGAKGNVQFRGSTPGIFTASQYFTYDIVGGGGIGNETLTLGPPGTNLSNNPLSVNSNVNSYLQSNVQNLSAGGSATSDIVATMNNGNDNSGYIDMGINSSGYNDPAYSIGQAGDGYLFCAGGDLALGTDTLNKNIIFHTAGTTTANERARITNTQFLAKTQIVSSGGGVGYATGAGGVVTQTTNRTNAVTLNKLCGNITLFSAAQASQAIITFTLNNTFIQATDLIIINHISATNGGAWNFSVVAANGSATITVRNVSTASITEATPLRFAIIKGVTA